MICSIPSLSKKYYRRQPLEMMLLLHPIIKDASEQLADKALRLFVRAKDCENKQYAVPTSIGFTVRLIEQLGDSPNQVVLVLMILNVINIL